MALAGGWAGGGNVQWTRAITKGSGGNESVRSNEMFALSIIT